MATIKFIVKGVSDPSTVSVRLRDGASIDYTVSTKLTISPKYWSQKNSWILPKADFLEKLNFENQLKELESKIFAARNKRLGEKLSITKEWFAHIVTNIEDEEDQFNNEICTLLENYKNELSTRITNDNRPISPATLRNFNTTIQRIKKFENHYQIKLQLTDLNLSFHQKYLEFALKKLGLSANSIGRDIKQIKTICFNARDNGLEINPMSISRKFNAPTEKTIFTTLTEMELELILNFEGPNYLNNARDWLIIGCWTGCRVGDLMALTNKNIIDHSDKVKIVRYTQSKTRKVVNVPLHPHVLSIVDRLNGFPRPISDVKFNLYIKEICKRVGMNELIVGTRQNPLTHKKEVGKFEKWQLVRSHICRRSFATNHYNKLSNKIIIAVTGHSTEKMLLNYIGETESVHINEYIDLWKI